MKGTVYLQGAFAFLPGQLWLWLCIGVLVALAVALVVVSIVFGGNRRRANTASGAAPTEQPGARTGR
jgi:hypothetical protein